MVKPEKQKGYLVRLKVLKDETDLLRVEIELYKTSTHPVIMDSLFDTSIIRASKLVRNSGFTMKSFREYLPKTLSARIISNNGRF